MFHSLLLPLDGSAFAENAVPLALSIARRAGATLNVLQVHEPFTPTYADSISPGIYEAEAKALEQKRAYLDGIVKRLTSVSPVHVTATLLEHPFVADALDGHAKSTGNDFIIMTTHGRGPLSRFWLGSVADELVRRATVPLLLIRPLETAPDFASEPQLRRIAIPLDGSTLAEQVLESAIGLGSLMQADYTLVHIYGPLVDSGVDPLNYATVGGHELSLEQRRTDAESYLNRVAKRLKERGFTVETHVGFAQHPASAILDSAEHLGMSLIALETHGRRGLTRLLLGSVADKVIRGASIPVLVHRSATSPSAG